MKRLSILICVLLFTVSAFSVEETKQRLRINDLPGNLNARDSFLALGFIDFDDNAAITSATLPAGWSRKDFETTYSDHLKYWLCDEKGLPRVEVTGKSAYYDNYAYANFFTPEEGLKKLQEHKLMEEQKEEEVQAKKAMEEKIIAARSPVGSKENSYAVIFVKDMTDLVIAGFVREHLRKSCMGFFPNKEIAEMAVEYLKQFTSYSDSNSDSVYYQKITKKEDIEILRNHYKVVDFGDTDWYSYMTFDSKNTQPVWIYS